MTEREKVIIDNLLWIVIVTMTSIPWIGFTASHNKIFVETLRGPPPTFLGKSYYYRF